MNVVHEMVISLDNLEALYGRLRVLGVFHVRHQVNRMMMMMMMFHVRHQVPHRYLDIMGPIFCNAVRPILLRSDAWCPEAGGYSAMDRKKINFPLFFSQTCLLQSIHPCSKVEEAWMEVFKVLTMIMKKSYEQGEAPSQQMSLDPTQGRYDIMTQLRDILFIMNVL